MAGIFAGREPYAPFKYFEEISAVPRGSGNEEGIARYLEAFAQKRGLEVYVDHMWNVLIKKPGTPGCQDLPPVLLQGHSDIVCEKNQGTAHDFEKDGIRLVVDGDILKADGTTLGGDDGYALAYMLAILDSDGLRHPPLECLFTSMEEIGLDGALAFDAGRLSARRMIGMDAGADGVFMISSAGGIHVAVTLPAVPTPCDRDALSISVRGLQGGHSGSQIKLERGNANQLLGRVLHRISQQISFNLSSVSGGMKDNAIPREADCVIAMEADCLDRAQEIARTVEAEILAELAFSDPGFRLELSPTRAAGQLDDQTTARALALQHLLPHGIVAMSMAVDGLVNASRNFAVVTQDDKSIRYDMSVRSAVDSLCTYVADQLCHLAQALGATAVTGSRYPAYPYAAQSKMRDEACRLYKELTGRDAQLVAIHGGTECGVLSGKIPGLDIISIGPDSGELHTPDEWMDLDSFGRLYTFLLAFLARLCE